MSPWSQSALGPRGGRSTSRSPGSAGRSERASPKHGGRPCTPPAGCHCIGWPAAGSEPRWKPNEATVPRRSRGQSQRAPHDRPPSTPRRLSTAPTKANRITDPCCESTGRTRMVSAERVVVPGPDDLEARLPGRGPRVLLAERTPALAAPPACRADEPRQAPASLGNVVRVEPLRRRLGLAEPVEPTPQFAVNQ